MHRAKPVSGVLLPLLTFVAVAQSQTQDNAPAPVLDPVLDTTIVTNDRALARSGEPRIVGLQFSARF